MKRLCFIAIYFSVLVTMFPALAHAMQDSTYIKVSFSDVIPTGFGSAYPISFVYNRDGNIINVFKPEQNSALSKFLSDNESERRPSRDPAVRTEAEMFSELLKESGEPLSHAISKTQPITILTFRSDPSVGDCPPCDRRKQLIYDARSSGSKFAIRDVAFVMY